MQYNHMRYRISKYVHPRHRKPRIVIGAPVPVAPLPVAEPAPALLRESPRSRVRGGGEGDAELRQESEAVAVGIAVAPDPGRGPWPHPRIGAYGLASAEAVHAEFHQERQAWESLARQFDGLRGDLVSLVAHTVDAVLAKRADAGIGVLAEKLDLLREDLRQAVRASAGAVPAAPESAPLAAPKPAAVRRISLDDIPAMLDALHASRM